MTADSRSFRLAVAQPLCLPYDIAANLQHMDPLVEEAAAGGARLVLFAECGVTGYRPDSPRIIIGDETCERLREMSRRNGTVIAAGFLELDGRKVHNTHGVFFPDGDIVFQRKTRLSAIEEAIPEFSPGEEKRVVFEVGGVRCAIAICADAGLPNLREDLVKEGVQLLLLPTAGCGPRELGFTEASLDAADVMERYLRKAGSVVFSPDAIRTCRAYRMAMASCNQMADNGADYFHPGHSMIVDASGELVALIPGSFVFEHLRPRLAIGEICPCPPRLPVSR